MKEGIWRRSSREKPVKHHRVPAIKLKIERNLKSNA